MDISELMRIAIDQRASDIHISAGQVPMIRIDGEVEKMNMPELSREDAQILLHEIMDAEQRKIFDLTSESDFAIEMESQRFRVNVMNQSRGMAAVLRLIPREILTLGDLQAPKIFSELSLKPRGLVLVTGPTGSGKSTTLAAMANHYNENRKGHILTIENPIEFVHRGKLSTVNQREIGKDTETFSNALRAAMRQDPDVILVGEMRDVETIRLALTAAETGHLVFATLHTSSAIKTVDRIVDVFPGDEKAMVRTMLSESLEAVISQTLIKRKDGKGRVAAHEIMLATPAVRNLIREAKGGGQMYSSIQTGNSAGMCTLDQTLADMVKKSVITSEAAKRIAKQPENFSG